MSVPVIPVLMSGGRGSRLWPLSRVARPKQLQPLSGAATLLQTTATRLAGLEGLASPILVCGAAHSTEALEQLAAVGCHPPITIAEPVGRNTAPAITAAAVVAPPDSVLVVLPADHIVTDLEAFRDSVTLAVAEATEGAIVTFGVVPSRVETGYGYIEASGDGPVRRIVEFLEKPDAETAGRLVDGGRHFWNSGMFVFRPDSVLEEVRRHAPEIADSVVKSLASATAPIMRPGPEFATALSIPFDVAVMEKTARGVMIPLDAGWDDVGSWRSLWEVSERDRDENALVGDVISQDTHRSYIRAADRPVVVLGLDDVAVVDAGDVVFVASMRHAQDVRNLVTRLEKDRPDLT